MARGWVPKDRGFFELSRSRGPQVTLPKKEGSVLERFATKRSRIVRSAYEGIKSSAESGSNFRLYRPERKKHDARTQVPGAGAQRRPPPQVPMHCSPSAAGRRTQRPPSAPNSQRPPGPQTASRSQVLPRPVDSAQTPKPKSQYNPGMQRSSRCAHGEPAPPGARHVGSALLSQRVPRTQPSKPTHRSPSRPAGTHVSLPHARFGPQLGKASVRHGSPLPGVAAQTSLRHVSPSWQRCVGQGSPKPPSGRQRGTASV